MTRRSWLLLLAGGLLIACRREPRLSKPEPGFQRYSADDVVRTLREAGLAVEQIEPRPIATVTPNPALPRQPRVREGGAPIEPMIEVEARNFVIPSLGGRGGRIFVFDSAERLRAKQIWFARFPDLYPYVYPAANVLLWLDSALPVAEAERYRQALTALDR